MHVARPILIAFLFVSAAGCASDPALDEAERPRLETWWELYQAADPGWEAARERWCRKDGEARLLLIDLLARDMFQRAVERGWQRPQRELLLLGGDDVADRLLEFMRGMREPAGLEVLSDTLARFGAVDSLIGAIENPRPDDAPHFAHYAYKALVRSGGSRAVRFVAAALGGDPLWERRAAAADALALARMSDQALAAREIADLLPVEADPSVLRRDLAALAALDQPRSARAVADLLAKLVERGDAATGQAAVDTLKRLTRATVANDDPSAWKQVALDAAAAAHDR